MKKEINQRAATVSPTRATVRVNGTQTFTINNTSATIDRYSTTNGRMSVDDFTPKTVTITGRVEGEDVLIIVLTDGTQFEIPVTISNSAVIPPPEPEPEPEPTIIPVTGIECDAWEVNLKVNETRQMRASVIPSNATNQLLHWSSNASSVATVSNSGLITAKSVGYAKVTALTDDGGYPYDIHVNVTSNTTTPEPTPPVNPNPPTTNSAPTIGAVLVSNEDKNGSFTLTYTANDLDGDTLTHKLKLNNGAYSTINPTKSGNNYSI